MRKRILILAALCALTAALAGCRAAPEKDAAKTEKEPTAAQQPEVSGETEPSAPAAKDEELAGITEEEEIALLCATFFTSFASLDGETAGGLLTSGDPIRFSELHGALSQHVLAELGTCSVSGDSADVNVTVTNADIAAVLHGLPEDIASEEEATEAMIAALEQPDAPTAVFTFPLLLTHESGEWRIVMTPELSDALLGGYYTMLSELAQTIGEEEQP